MLANWEVGHTQETVICDIPAFEKIEQANEKSKWSIFWEMAESEIKNGEKILIFSRCFHGLAHMIQVR